MRRSAVPREFGGWGRAAVPALLFAGTFITTAFQVPTVRLGSGFETLSIARNLAAHGQFANPFSPLITGSTAHAAPLYPAFLAGLIWMFGNSALFVMAVDGITIAIHGLHAALLPTVSQLFFQDRRPGVWAGVLTIVLPVFFLFPQYEIMCVATGLMLFCLAAHRLVLRGGIAHGLPCGLGIGLLALLNPASITVAALWVAYLLWRQRPARAGRFVGYAALAAAATLAPWTWRNYREFHRLFFVRDNFGLELYIANNDLAEASFDLNEANGCHRRLHPAGSDVEARECRALGEAEYYRRRGAAALDWIRRHPGRFGALTAARLRMFWFPDINGAPGYAYTIAFISVAGFMGMLLLRQRQDPIVMFLAGASLVYPAVYYFVQLDPRYRTPFLWVPLLAGGYFLADLTTRASSRRR
jgi:hypothetical protein